MTIINAIKELQVALAGVDHGYESYEDGDSRQYERLIVLYPNDYSSASDALDKLIQSNFKVDSFPDEFQDFIQYFNLIFLKRLYLHVLTKREYKLIVYSSHNFQKILECYEENTVSLTRNSINIDEFYERYRSSYIKQVIGLLLQMYRAIFELSSYLLILKKKENQKAKEKLLNDTFKSEISCLIEGCLKKLKFIVEIKKSNRISEDETQKFCEVIVRILCNIYVLYEDIDASLVDELMYKLQNVKETHFFNLPTLFIFNRLINKKTLTNYEKFFQRKFKRMFHLSFLYSTSDATNYAIALQFFEIMKLDETMELDAKTKLKHDFNMNVKVMGTKSTPCILIYEKLSKSEVLTNEYGENLFLKTFTSVSSVAKSKKDQDVKTLSEKFLANNMNEVNKEVEPIEVDLSQPALSQFFQKFVNVKQLEFNAQPRKRVSLRRNNKSSMREVTIARVMV